MPDLGCPHLESSAIALEEVTQHLRDFRSQTESDPERMEVIDSRLAGLQRLKKKYGKTIEELVVLVQSLEQDLALLARKGRTDSQTPIRSDE